MFFSGSDGFRTPAGFMWRPIFTSPVFIEVCRISTTAWEVLSSVKILVILNPSGYMLTSSGFAFRYLRYIL